AHLKECPECAAELAAFASVGAALAQLPAQHDPPAALRARIMATAAAAQQKRSARVPALAPWLAAAGMLLVPRGLGLPGGPLGGCGPAPAVWGCSGATRSRAGTTASAASPWRSARRGRRSPS